MSDRTSSGCWGLRGKPGAPRENLAVQPVCLAFVERLVVVEAIKHITGSRQIRTATVVLSHMTVAAFRLTTRSTFQSSLRTFCFSEHSFLLTAEKVFRPHSRNVWFLWSRLSELNIYNDGNMPTSHEYIRWVRYDAASAYLTLYTSLWTRIGWIVLYSYTDCAAALWSSLRHFARQIRVQVVDTKDYDNTTAKHSLPSWYLSRDESSKGANAESSRKHERSGSTQRALTTSAQRTDVLNGW